MRSEKGQSLVEFAMILPVLTLILIAILDFSLTLYTYIAINEAGREATRAATIGKSDIEIQQVVLNSAGGLDPLKITTTISPNQTNRTQGSYVTVTIKYPVSFLSPLTQVFFPNPYIIQINTVMRVE